MDGVVKGVSWLIRVGRRLHRTYKIINVRIATPAMDPTTPPAMILAREEDDLLDGMSVFVGVPVTVITDTTVVGVPSMAVGIVTTLGAGDNED
jgi:hypothetical protein